MRVPSPGVRQFGELGTSNIMKITISDKSATHRGTVLLAPSLSAVPETFAHAGVDPGRHEVLLGEMQRLRGVLYLEDGAITEDQLTSDGRHKLSVDDRSWHLLTLDENGRVCGCLRYCLYPGAVSYPELGVSRSALAGSSQWSNLLKTAVDTQIALARKLQIGFAEIGGWALAREHRCTTEALRIALGTYSLAGLLGDAVGVSTATVRNCSASILRRIGGARMDVSGFLLPAYHDPQYNCEMEILRFDSRYPAERFAQGVEKIRQQLICASVVCASAFGSTSLPRREPVTRYAPQFAGLAAASAA